MLVFLASFLLLFILYILGTGTNTTRRFGCDVYGGHWNIRVEFTKNTASGAIDRRLCDHFSDGDTVYFDLAVAVVVGAIVWARLAEQCKADSCQNLRKSRGDKIYRLGLCFWVNRRVY